MIRPFTLLAALLFLLSGAYLFAVKHRSQMLDEQIAQVTQATRLDEQRIRVLQAQWALEADPSRLAQLSTQFTHLQPMQPSQLVTLTALATALPPPGAVAPAPNPADVVPVIAVASAQPPPPPPAPAPPPTVKLASAPPPSRMASVETLLRTLPAHPRHFARIHRESLARELTQNRPSYMGGSALAPIAMAAPPPLLGAQVMSVRAMSQPPAPMPAYGGSMLGMAQSAGQSGSAN